MPRRLHSDIRIREHVRGLNERALPCSPTDPETSRDVQAEEAGQIVEVEDKELAEGLHKVAGVVRAMERSMARTRIHW